ncbi:MAG: hypothetical protein M3144_02835, partial [Actinomycetota bacterium]|nr:hypothetical protein [Actinomycetota bacterium]
MANLSHPRIRRAQRELATFERAVAQGRQGLPSVLLVRGDAAIATLLAQGRDGQMSTCSSDVAAAAMAIPLAALADSPSGPPSVPT